MQVVYWKWIAPKLLGLVTQTAVYHWSIEGKMRFHGCSEVNSTVD